MKTFYFLSTVLGIAFLMSCGNNKSTNQEDNFNYPTTDPLLNAKKTESGPDTLAYGKQCFLAHIRKDSAFLNLDRNGNNISGTLHYKFREKDNSKGNLTGTIQGDTLVLNYTFSSEGTESERPIRFVYEKGNIYEVYDKKRPSRDSAFIFLPVECL